MTTPLDSINEMKNKEVLVQLKDGKEITGKLMSFDLSSNIGIEVKGNLEFIQGELVSAVSLAEKQ